MLALHGGAEPSEVRRDEEDVRHARRGEVAKDRAVEVFVADEKAVGPPRPFGVGLIRGAFRQIRHRDAEEIREPAEPRRNVLAEGHELALVVDDEAAVGGLPEGAVGPTRRGRAEIRMKDRGGGLREEPHPGLTRRFGKPVPGGGKHPFGRQDGHARPHRCDAAQKRADLFDSRDRVDPGEEVGDGLVRLDHAVGDRRRGLVPGDDREAPAREHREERRSEGGRSPHGMLVPEGEEPAQTGGDKPCGEKKADPDPFGAEHRRKARPGGVEERVGGRQPTEVDEPRAPDPFEKADQGRGEDRPRGTLREAAGEPCGERGEEAADEAQKRHARIGERHGDVSVRDHALRRPGESRREPTESERPDECEGGKRLEAGSGEEKRGPKKQREERAHGCGKNAAEGGRKERAARKGGGAGGELQGGAPRIHPILSTRSV